MTHPTNEEWMSYLYDELESSEQTRLKTHLESCRECQSQVNGWQGTMRAMSTWELPDVKRQSNPLSLGCEPEAGFARPSESFTGWQYIKWGVAAMVMLCAGYGLARVSAPAPDVAAIRASLEPEIRQVVKRELEQAKASAVASANAETRRLMAELSRNLDSKQEEDRQAVSDILKRLEAKRVNDLVNLRKELETVAVNAESSLETTQQQLVQLASFTQPGNVSLSPEGTK